MENFIYDIYTSLSKFKTKLEHFSHTVFLNLQHMDTSIN